MSLALLFHYLMLNMFRMLIHPSSGACDLFVELSHGLYWSVRIEVFALACLFSGECLVVTCMVVLKSLFMLILAAAVSYGYWVSFVCSMFFDNVSWIYSNVVYISCIIFMYFLSYKTQLKVHNFANNEIYYQLLRTQEETKHHRLRSILRPYKHSVLLL